MTSFMRNVPLLAVSQALMISAMSLILATSALVGIALAEDRSLATLPVALLAISAMFTSIPAAMLMERIGRKRGFVFSSLFGIAGSLLSFYAILESDFWLFSAGCFLIGIFNGFGSYFRFSAADAVDRDHKSRAISFVMAGGVIAAFIGTNIANVTHTMIDTAPFAGSYAALTGFYLLSMFTLSFLNLPSHLTNDESGHMPEPRSFSVITAQPKFRVALICGMFGYGVMALIMAATPLAMAHHMHPFDQIAFVIQWHLVGMFAPAFFTGSLIRRFGVLSVMFIGALFGIICVTTNLLGTSSTHYWLALLLLGVSWNFLFIGATTLLTETYNMAERGKVQAMNDFSVFSTVAAASLVAGYLHHQFGWQAVNIGVLPLLLLMLVSIIWVSFKGDEKPVEAVQETVKVRVD